MNCREVRETVLMVIESDLEDDLLAPLQAHLDGCPECASYLDYSRRLLVLVRQRCRRERAPSGLRTKILTSFPHRQDTSSRPLEKR